MTGGLNGTGEYDFGEFTYQSSDNTLRRDGLVLPMTPKALELLRIFIANPGKLLSKDELMNELWPDSFVEESNLAVTIRRLRKVLSDDAHDPRYVETVARQGYRFVADVKAKETGRSSERPAKERSYRYLIPLAVAAGLLIASISLGSLYLQKASHAASILSAPFAVQRLSTSGKVHSAAISPEGDKVVYTVRNGPRESVWLEELATKNNVEIIPASEDDYYNFDFSPDGNVLYFTRGPRNVDDRADLYRVPIFGGVPAKIASDTRGWLSISPDGSLVSFVRCQRLENENCSLWIADSSNGGNERMIASRPRPFRIADHEISPDGKSVVFAAGQSESGEREFGLYSVDLASGAEQQIPSEKFFNIKSIEYLPEKTGLLVTGTRTATHDFRIWKIGPDGSSTPLTNDSATYDSISLDQTGSQLIATQVTYDFKLTRSSLSDTARKEIITVPAGNFDFDVNGDIVFQAGSTGVGELWRIEPNGTRTQLTTAQTFDYSPMVSPKTREIFFSSNRSGAMQVWRMKPDGSDQRQVTFVNGGMPAFVDPEWIYYQHSKDRSLWRCSLEDGREEQIFNRRPYRGRFAFSVDGTRAAFVDSKAEKRYLVILSIPDGRELERFDLAEGKGGFEIAWMPDSTAVAYTLSNLKDEANTLWIQAVEGGEPRRAGDLGAEDIVFLSFPREPGAVDFVQGSWKQDFVMLTGLQ